MGGKFADFFVARNLSLVLKWASPNRELVFQALNFQYWDFLFGLAFLIGLYALHRLSIVEEQGEVDDEVVRAEFMDVIKRPIRSLSTGAGLFQIISYPYSFIGRGIKYIEKVTQR